MLLFLVLLPMVGAINVEKELKQVKVENSQLKEVITSLQKIISDLQVCVCTIKSAKIQ